MRIDFTSNFRSHESVTDIDTSATAHQMMRIVQMPEIIIQLCC